MPTTLRMASRGYREHDRERRIILSYSPLRYVQCTLPYMQSNTCHVEMAAASSSAMAEQTLRVSSGGKLRAYVDRALQVLPVRARPAARNLSRALSPETALSDSRAERTAADLCDWRGGGQGGERGGDHEASAAWPAPEHTDRPTGSR